MEVILHPTRIEELFLAGYIIYLSVIVLAIIHCITALIRVFKNGEPIVDDDELFHRAGMLTRERSRKISIDDLIWELELKGALKVESCNSKWYKIQTKNPNAVKKYLSGFLRVSGEDGCIRVTKNNILLIMKS